MTGAENPEIDHLKGAKFKLKGVDKAGEWMVLPISHYLHSAYDYPHSMQVLGRRGFEKYHQASFRDKYMDMVLKYQKEKGRKPMSDYEYEIIISRGF